MPETSNGTGCLPVIAVFLLIVTPLYLVMRFFVSLVRQAYGFDTPDDDGPPLRICGRCHNTVLEPDFQHCPYCGNALADVSEPPV